VLQNTSELRDVPNRRPPQLKEALEACGAYNLIIDGTERERQRPSEPQAQKDFYSGKQENAILYNSSLSIEMRKRQTSQSNVRRNLHDKAICDEEQ